MIEEAPSPYNATNVFYHVNDSRSMVLALKPGVEYILTSVDSGDVYVAYGSNETVKNSPTDPVFSGFPLMSFSFTTSDTTCFIALQRLKAGVSKIHVREAR